MKGCVANNLLQPRIVRLIPKVGFNDSGIDQKETESLYTLKELPEMQMSFYLSVCKCLNNFLANLQRFFKFCDRSLKFIFYRSAEALKVFVLVLCSLVFDYQ